MKKKAPTKRRPQACEKKWLRYDEFEDFVERHAIADWPDDVDKHHTAYVVVEDRLLEDGSSFSNIKGFLQKKHAELYADSIFGNVDHRILVVTSSWLVPARPVVPKSKRKKTSR